jgi:HEAT repeat protein
MSKVDDYKHTLRTLPEAEWDAYLLANSNLPGPRGNLELAAAVADEASASWLLAHASDDPAQAPENTPGCFLACCAVQGLGRLIAGGEDVLPLLRRSAADPRWRVRESVAMALQRLGDADMPRLLEIAAEFATIGPLEQRAAAAGLAEPRLLHDRAHAAPAIAVLDAITQSIAEATDRKSDAFRALRQGMGYCWSVVVAAYLEEGKLAFERWLDSPDKDVRWLLKENLKKNRLQRLDPAWVADCRAKLG